MSHLQRSVLAARSRHVAILMLVLAGGLMPAAAQQTPPNLTPRVQAVLKEAAEARERSDTAVEREAIERGLREVGETAGEAHFLHAQMSQNYADLGNMQRSAEYVEKMYATAKFPPQEWAAVVRALAIYAALHNKPKVRQFSTALDQLMPRLRSHPFWPRLGSMWQAGAAWAKGSAQRMAGHFAEAEDSYKACIASAEQQLRTAADNQPAYFYIADCSAGLILTQLATGQLAAAGVVADQMRVAVDEVNRRQRRPAVVSRVRGVHGQLAMEQGRFDEARSILLDTVASLQADKESSSSLRVAFLFQGLAMLDMLQGRWEPALAWHRKREAHLRDMGRDRGSSGTLSPEYAYTLLRLGKTDEALAMAERVAANRATVLDERSVGLWEARAFHGIALAAAGRREEAARLLREAVPKYLDLVKGERSSAEAGILRTARLNWLLDGYIALLAGQATTDAAAVDEAFRMADLARGSTVQRALAASASRANISDPALADLARREQDLQREISSLSESIGNLLSRGRIAEQDKVVVDMRAELARLREQHAAAQAEIERHFPDYAALLNPKPAGIAAVQKLLKPSEAVVAVYAGSDRTLVWAIPARGQPAFAVVALTGSQLDVKVATLREALDPNADAAGKLPKFRFDISHELYTQLLAPVEAGWKGARELIVIPHGRLGQLPFGVLTTAPFSAPSAKLAFAEMAAAPWLIKEVGISQLPAAVALPALRSGASRRAERAFVGFGDPVFTADAGAAATRGTGAGIQRRNLGIAKAPPKPDAEPELAPAIDFRLLSQLPDTALEVEEVAGVLGADKARDVFLHRRASEARVKQTDLSPYRVVMFATHGLMNGELPGLFQPALALSNPALTGDGEDGLLTMEEILGLKLRADWVVLSACNSAAAGGQSGESVSGLGRAFFYAGAKSLLVTNWAVETESARMLTTEAFRRQAADPALPRARALQQSALSLMGKVSGNGYSYAHPMFWAPYTLVGDGG